MVGLPRRQAQMLGELGDGEAVPLMKLSVVPHPFFTPPGLPGAAAEAGASAAARHGVVATGAGAGARATRVPHPAGDCRR